MKSLTTSFFLLLCLVPVFAAASESKNVLIIFMDDLRPELGCYGHPVISSPNIDALAADGVLFERAYCQQGICAPSRASMMAGQYPDTLGIYDLWSPLRRTVPDAMSMPRYFTQRGFETSSFGKVYHHHIDDKPYWSHLPAVPGEKYAAPQTLAKIARQKRLAQAKGLKGVDLFLSTQGPPIENADVPDDTYPDGAVANQAIETLRQKRDKPFFMCVGFAKPHLPFAAPKRYWDLYKREQFAVPRRKLPTDAPVIAFTNWGELRAYAGIPSEGPLSDDQTQQLMHGYAACVSYADAQVGKVIAELDRLGLRDNTIVVLWGDHGYKLGDYGLWCKHTNLELDTRVPLIVSAPGFAKGVRTKALVEIVDLFPTLAKLTGGEPPPQCDGNSFVRILEKPAATFREFAISQYPRGSVMGYSIRTERWRYTEWIDAKTRRVVDRELYDHQTTQRPSHNLADNAEHQELIADLSQYVDATNRIKNAQLK
ncbi:sulfatase [Novipirellula maiorica]|uniref:sulfatase n=1 Tax=Novipirellula maiorica TaxID=1265734 RepID=UPI000348A001|nr:sulfatase [Rhodopirellula maiorica]